MLAGIGGASVGYRAGRPVVGSGLETSVQAAGAAHTVDTPLTFQLSRTGYRATVRLAVPDDT